MVLLTYPYNLFLLHITYDLFSLPLPPPSFVGLEGSKFLFLSPHHLTFFSFLYSLSLSLRSLPRDREEEEGGGG